MTINELNILITGLWEKVKNYVTATLSSNDIVTKVTKKVKSIPTSLIRVHHNIPANAQEGYVYTACNYRHPHYSVIIPYPVFTGTVIDGTTMEDYVFDITRYFPTLAQAEDMLLPGTLGIRMKCFERDGRILASYNVSAIESEYAKDYLKLKFIKTILTDHRIIPISASGDHSRFTYIEGRGLVSDNIKYNTNSRLLGREIPIDEKFSKIIQVKYILAHLKIRDYGLSFTDTNANVSVDIHPVCLISTSSRIEMQAYKKDRRLRRYRWVSTKYKHKLESGNNIITISNINRTNSYFHTDSDTKKSPTTSNKLFGKKIPKLFLKRKFDNFVRARIKTGEWFYFKVDIGKGRVESNSTIKPMNWG